MTIRKNSGQRFRARRGLLRQRRRCRPEPHREARRTTIGAPFKHGLLQLTTLRSGGMPDQRNEFSAAAHIVHFDCQGVSGAVLGDPTLGCMLVEHIELKDSKVRRFPFRAARTLHEITFAAPSMQMKEGLAGKLDFSSATVVAFQKIIVCHSRTRALGCRSAGSSWKDSITSLRAADGERMVFLQEHRSQFTPRVRGTPCAIICMIGRIATLRRRSSMSSSSVSDLAFAIRRSLLRS